MKKRTSARRYNHSRKKQVHESSAFSNQLSIALILTAFIFVISAAQNPHTIELRKKASALISYNALENFKYQNSVKENVSEFIRCMINTDNNTKEIEKQIINDTESASIIIPSEDDITMEDETPE